jgi:hypothetical protein
MDECSEKTKIQRRACDSILSNASDDRGAGIGTLKMGKMGPERGDIRQTLLWKPLTFRDRAQGFWVQQ